MTHPITIQVPDEVYLPLLKLAKEQGQSVEAIASARLADAVYSAPGARLRKWCGATSSNVPDASLRHDDYLGQDVLDESQGMSQ